MDCPKFLYLFSVRFGAEILDAYRVVRGVYLARHVYPTYPNRKDSNRIPVTDCT